MDKIVVLDGYTENPGDLSWSGLEKLGELTVYDYTPIDDEEEIIKRIADAKAIYTNKTPITRAVIEACPSVEFIGVLATGYNVVDCTIAKEKGITVCNIPTYSTNAVAQFTFALLLEICHNVGHHSNAVHDGRWQASRDFCFWDYPLMELLGKTIGIIGFGRIGQATAVIAKAMGMNVIAYNRSQSEQGKLLAEYVDLDTLFAKADIISLHCPLTEQTENIICKENIAKMKDGVIILNTGRGPLINEQDLTDALNSDKVYAAAVDVVSREPIFAENPLLKAKNCIITPHIAWASKESRARLMDIAVENYAQFKKGNPINVVN
ncbi:MAG: D-2-hydroxyacid dehydrogenase [Clostridia bacterium]